MFPWWGTPHTLTDSVESTSCTPPQLRYRSISDYREPRYREPIELRPLTRAFGLFFRCLIHDFAAYHGPQNFGVAHFLGGDCQNIPVEQDQISSFARCDASDSS